MCGVQVAAKGPESSFAWPVCNHLLHLGCMPHLAANSFVLSCPSCRAGWEAGAAELLHAQCRRHLVAIPAPAPQEDTRTDEALVVQPPRAPAQVLAFCCPRLFLARPGAPETEGAWQELGDRSMQWSPVFDQATRTWRPEWVCLRCNNCLGLAHALLQGVPDRPRCAAHGERVLAVDMREGRRGWACCQGSSGMLHDCTLDALPLEPSLPAGALVHLPRGVPRC